jgi:hypothetical protein
VVFTGVREDASGSQHQALQMEWQQLVNHHVGCPRSVEHPNSDQYLRETLKARLKPNGTLGLNRLGSGINNAGNTSVI